MTENLLHITDGSNKLLALVIRSQFSVLGTKFFTPNTYSQQVAYMNRPAGASVNPHKHIITEQPEVFTQELLVIKQGRVRIDIYNDESAFVTSCELIDGDVILLVAGAHGLEFIEPTVLVEVKQGPYSDANRVDIEIQRPAELDKIGHK